MADHQLEQRGKKDFRCTVCGKEWRAAPRSTCAGVMVYPWNKWPDTLATKEQLFAKRLRLTDGQKHVAESYGQHLYEVAAAIPLDRFLEFVHGSYTFVELPEGFEIWRKTGQCVRVRYEGTYLHLDTESWTTRVGLYEWKNACTSAADHFMDLVWRGENLESGLTYRSLAGRFFKGWRRIIEQIAPPEMVALSRAMFASVQGDASILHEPGLYTDEYKHVLADLKKYHACRMYAKSLIEVAPANLEKLKTWREMLSPTIPNKALNKTLDKLPVGVSYRMITRLSTIRLEQPILKRLQLIFVLCASDHHNWGIHERTVMAATPEMIQEAARLQNRTLKHSSKTHAIKDVASFILDYPQPYRGDLLGLARLSAEWHQRFDDEGSAMLPRDTELPIADCVDFERLAELGITPLRTAGDCYDERDRMRHCIHTYASKAHSGLCFLFHVDHVQKDPNTDVETRTQATVEVDVNGHVAQAHGPQNQKNAACYYGVDQLQKAFGGYRVERERNSRVS